MYDISIHKLGTICTINQETQKAKDWVKENVFLETWQCSGDFFYMEPWWAEELAQIMTEAGLTVQHY